MDQVYMDYNATAPVRPEVMDAMAECLRDCYGNPSSTHFAGRTARRRLDAAREEVAAAIGARAPEIVFTAGGTEGDNLAVKGVVAAAGPAGKGGPDRGHIVTTGVEHPAVLECCRYLESRGYAVTYLPVDGDGGVDASEVGAAIRDDTVLVSVMWVNNETGVIQPIEEIAGVASERGVPVHTDAVQAFGRLAIDVGRVPVDLLTISGHKFGAPKGVGALFVRKGTVLEPILHGGGQERALRSSTVNVPGAVALATAARLAVAEVEAEAARQGALRDRFEAAVTAGVPDAAVNGAGAARVSNTSNLRFDGADGEAVLIALDEQAIAASSASACAASHSEPSYVLTAMGLTRRQAEDSMRFSIGRMTETADVDRCAAVLPGIVERIRAIRSAG